MGADRLAATRGIAKTGRDREGFIMRSIFYGRRRLGLLIGTAVAATLATPAWAQDAVRPLDCTPTDTRPECAEAQDDTIVVTGSRLARDPNATAPAPISTVTAADLVAAGNADSTATLRQIPALISSGTVADSIERGAGGVGQATLNLRQLGANRTLVLVDGYRHVSGVAGSQTVDVSTIPTALLESVEVLTGGASAVYGADAVTGVVNYKLRKDFTGLELNLRSSISSKGDGGSQGADITYGRNFAGGARQYHAVGGLYARAGSAARRPRLHPRQRARQQ